MDSAVSLLRSAVSACADPLTKPQQRREAYQVRFSVMRVYCRDLQFSGHMYLASVHHLIVLERMRSCNPSSLCSLSTDDLWSVIYPSSSLSCLAGCYATRVGAGYQNGCAILVYT